MRKSITCFIIDSTRQKNRAHCCERGNIKQWQIEFASLSEIEIKAPSFCLNSTYLHKRLEIYALPQLPIQQLFTPKFTLLPMEFLTRVSISNFQRESYNDIRHL